LKRKKEKGKRKKERGKRKEEKGKRKEDGRGLSMIPKSKIENS
jgi:hypothetical protein